MSKWKAFINCEEELKQLPEGIPSLFYKNVEDYGFPVIVREGYGWIHQGMLASRVTFYGKTLEEWYAEWDEQPLELTPSYISMLKEFYKDNQ